MSDESRPLVPHSRDATGPRGPDGRFQPGFSGHPSGRPRRSREVQALLDELAPAALARCRALIAEGNVAAIRIVTSLGVPQPRADVAQVDLGNMCTIAGCQRALARIADAVGTGFISPAEAGPLTAIVEASAKMVQAADIEQRLAALEDRARDQ